MPDIDADHSMVSLSPPAHNPSSPPHPSLSVKNALPSPPSTSGTSPQLDTTHTTSQLAALLSTALADADALKRDLAKAERRAARAERLVAALQGHPSALSPPKQSPATSASDPSPSSSSPSDPHTSSLSNGMLPNNPNANLPESAVKAIVDADDRAERAERARDESQTHLNAILSHWKDLERFLNLLDLRASDARAAFSRFTYAPAATSPPSFDFSIPNPPSSLSSNFNLNGYTHLLLQAQHLQPLVTTGLANPLPPHATVPAPLPRSSSDVGTGAGPNGRRNGMNGSAASLAPSSSHHRHHVNGIPAPTSAPAPFSSIPFPPPPSASTQTHTQALAQIAGGSLVPAKRLHYQRSSRAGDGDYEIEGGRKRRREEWIGDREDEAIHSPIIHYPPQHQQSLSYPTHNHVHNQHSRDDRDGQSGPSTFSPHSVPPPHPHNTLVLDPSYMPSHLYSSHLDPNAHGRHGGSRSRGSSSSRAIGATPTRTHAPPLPSSSLNDSMGPQSVPLGQAMVHHQAQRPRGSSYASGLHASNVGLPNAPTANGHPHHKSRSHHRSAGDRGRGRTREGGRSRSRGRSSSAGSSWSIDEMLLEATSGGERERVGDRGEYVRERGPSGPAPAVQMAVPVVAQSKGRDDGAPNAPQPAPQLPGGGYPPTNAAGQRICRQCGMAGRYKDGKCVEKWGPGPEGPGTVCDRCRKKMKRVERRGTIDASQASAASFLSSQSGSIGRARVSPPRRQDTLIISDLQQPPPPTNSRGAQVYSVSTSREVPQPHQHSHSNHHHHPANGRLNGAARAHSPGRGDYSGGGRNGLGNGNGNVGGGAYGPQRRLPTPPHINSISTREQGASVGGAGRGGGSRASSFAGDELLDGEGDGGEGDLDVDAEIARTLPSSSSRERLRVARASIGSLESLSSLSGSGESARERPSPMKGISSGGAGVYALGGVGALRRSIHEPGMNGHGVGWGEGGRAVKSSVGKKGLGDGMDVDGDGDADAEGDADADIMDAVDAAGAVKEEG